MFLNCLDTFKFLKKIKLKYIQGDTLTKITYYFSQNWDVQLYLFHFLIIKKSILLIFLLSTYNTIILYLIFI